MMYIDVLGQPCPIPVIKAKEELAKGEVQKVIVLVDNIVAVQNLEKMANGLGYSFSSLKNDEDYFEVTLARVELQDDASKAYRQNKVVDYNSENRLNQNSEQDLFQSKSNVSKDNGLVVVIGRDTMGSGEEALGKILIKGFIFSLTALDKLPDSVIFLNKGAFLTSEESNTVEDLKCLEEKGVTILTCGTCSNFYNLQDKLAVGTITDMYGITEKMALAGKVVNI